MTDQATPLIQAEVVTTSSDPVTQWTATINDLENEDDNGKMLEPGERSTMPRKLSQSRGVNLPAIKLEEPNRRRTVGFEDELVKDGEYSPPITNSPVGYTLRHDSGLLPDMNRTSTSESFNIDTVNMESFVDIRIFFSNGKSIRLFVEDGLKSTAADLLDVMAEHLQLEEGVAAESLALWLISPLLEVQLKPYHVAYEVREKWPLFLRRFTTCSEEDMAFDDPLLVVRRNVQLSISTEMSNEEEYERLNEVLYYDAKDEYMAGRCIVDVETSIKLAALQLAIDRGPSDDKEDEIALIHDMIDELVPPYLVGRMKSFHLFGIAMMECRKGVEKQIFDNYKIYSQKCANNYERRKAYLNILRCTPFYGATFFSGTTDRRQSMPKRLLTGAPAQMDLRIGINRDYITLVDPQKNELLLVRRISDCTWFRSSDSEDEDHEIPSFFLHFPTDDALDHFNELQEKNILDEGPLEVVSRLLQIFTKQAPMIDALMNSLFEVTFGSDEDIHSPDTPNGLHNHDQSPSTDVSSPSSVHELQSKSSNSIDAAKSNHSSSSSSSTYSHPSKLSKLCFATLDPNGRCIEAYGNLKRILLECQ